MPSGLRRFSRHWHQHLPTLLPSSCALCGRCGQSLCDACRAQFFAPAPPRCRRCAIPLPAVAAEVCGHCLKAPPAFDATVVAADYAAPLDQLVQGLKFGHRLALAPLFAQLLHEALRRTGVEAPALLTAVPLAPQRLAQRGFNQALEIARPLSAMLDIELAPQLALRRRETRPQTLLRPEQRRQNIRNAFLVDGRWLARIAGRHVGVVDDVITTGGTLGELAAVLKRHGAARVTNLVFARTPPPH